MSLCPNCGKEVPEGTHFCPSCGAPVAGAAPAAAPYVDPDDHTAEFDEADRERNKLLALLCYVSIAFAFLALIAEPGSKFLRYHVNQVILINALFIAGAIVCVIPVLGWIAFTVASIAALVFSIMGAIRAYKGEAKDIPIIGKYVVIHWD